MSLSCPLVARLIQWGRWAHDGQSLGYRRSIRYDANQPGSWLPDDELARIDQAIAQTSAEFQIIIESRYLLRRPDRQAAARIGCSISTYRRRVRAIHLELSARLAAGDPG